jgi:uncharacterized membrane protein
MEQQNRFKSWALWVAVAALLSTLLNDMGLVESAVFDDYVEKLLYILALAGIINNPTDKKKI